MQGYVAIHRNVKLTCSNGDNNRILDQQTDNDLVCKRICDEDESCKFFYLNIEGYCVIYKSCKVKRDAYQGTTYKKTEEKGKCKTDIFLNVFQHEYNFLNENCLYNVVILIFFT